MFKLFIAFFLVTSLPFALAQTLGDEDVPPEFVHLPDTYIDLRRSGFDDFLYCEAIGSPMPNYTWYKDGAILNLEPPPSYILRSRDKTGTLKFNGIIPDTAAGLYQCVATNAHGRAFSNFAQVFKPSINITYNMASPPNANLSARDGDYLTIPCTGIISHPEPDLYTWHVTKAARISVFEGVVINENDRVAIDQKGSLHFAYLLSGDTGIDRYYRCRAHNGRLDKDQFSIFTEIHSTGAAPVAERAPKLMYKSPTVIVKEGEKAVLECIFSANPAAVIRWTRLTSSGEETISEVNVEFKFHRLTIKSVTIANAGKYRCKGSNSIGEAVDSDLTNTLELHVGILPVITRPPQSVVVETSSDATFSCYATGVPEPVITWYTNGVQLDANNLPHYMTLQDNRRILTIHNVCRDCPKVAGRPTDMMNIQCNASNEIGHQFVNAYLKVNHGEYRSTANNVIQHFVLVYSIFVSATILNMMP